MEMKDIIRNRRLELELTQKEVADYVGVSEATLSRWESGEIKNLRRNRIAALAKILQISPAAIVGDIDSDPANATVIRNVLRMPQMYQVPLIGAIACGEPITAEENIEEYVDVPEHVKADFALRCKGDSMINARI